MTSDNPSLRAIKKNTAEQRCNNTAGSRGGWGGGREGHCGGEGYAEAVAEEDGGERAGETLQGYAVVVP
jgi:hypothetical protein